MNDDWKMTSFNVDVDNSSYFDKTIEKRLAEEKQKIINQVQAQAGKAIHDIVTAKDKEIELLNNKIKELEVSLNESEQTSTTLPPPPLPSGNVSDLTDFDIINNAFTYAIKYGELTDDDLNDEKLETIRKVVVMWKEFFEEYKWKSNYISNKIKNLLKETNNIL